MTYADVADMLRRDRVRRSRGRTFGRFLGRLLLVLVTTAFDGYLFMLAVEIAHDHWIPQLPTIGYEWAVVLVWVLRAVFTPIKWDRDGTR